MPKTKSKRSKHECKICKDNGVAFTAHTTDFCAYPGGPYSGNFPKMAEALRESEAQQKLLQTAKIFTPTSAEPSPPANPLESQPAFIGVQSDVYFLKHDTIVTTDDLRNQIKSLSAEVQQATAELEKRCCSPGFKILQPRFLELYKEYSTLIINFLYSNIIDRFEKVVSRG